MQQLKIGKFEYGREGSTWFEDRIARATARTRQIMDVDVGDFITVISIDGLPIVLQIEDLADENADFVAVSPEIYRRTRVEEPVKPVTGITLGCDPEVFIVEASSGRVVRPSEFMSYGKGQLGYDGTLLEFRPNYGTSAEVVAKNLWELIAAARRMLDKSGWGHDLMLWGASSFNGYTAGFHLHYGLPSGLLGQRVATKRMAGLMTYVMDYYVGTLSVIAEGDNDNTRRTAPMIKYGKPGGFHIDNRTFEYRFPGGSLMRHPRLARGLMALGAVVTEDLVSRIAECTDGFSNFNVIPDLRGIADLYPGLPDIHTLYGILCSHNTLNAKARFKRITEDVKSMVGYNGRIDAIEDFFEIIGPHGENFCNIIDKNWLGG